MNIAVFVSGRGTNLQAIIESDELKNKAFVKLVVCNKKECGAFRIAEKYAITHYSLKPAGGITIETLLEIFKSEGIKLIVLAGYLKMIPEALLKAYQNSIINIHPALLPSFGGPGMYGMRVHEEVFKSSAKVSGVTVHFIDNEYDKGKIIAQQCVDITDVKSPEEIAERVLKIEHFLLPYVIGKFAENKIKVVNERVVVL